MKHYIIIIALIVAGQISLVGQNAQPRTTHLTLSDKHINGIARSVSETITGADNTVLSLSTALYDELGNIVTLTQQDRQGNSPTPGMTIQYNDHGDPILLSYEGNEENNLPTVMHSYRYAPDNTIISEQRSLCHSTEQYSVKKRPESTTAIHDAYTIDRIVNIKYKTTKAPYGHKVSAYYEDGVSPFMTTTYNHDWYPIQCINYEEETLEQWKYSADGHLLSHSIGVLGTGQVTEKEIYSYSSKGLLLSVKSDIYEILINYGEDGEEVLVSDEPSQSTVSKFEYSDYDNHSNWLRRTETTTGGEQKETIVTTRKISYYR